jgi:hypothetical protein
MKQFIFLFFMITSFQACKNDSPEPEKEIVYSTKLDGNYDLITIYSTVAVDIDRDGISNTDMQVEIPVFEKKDVYYLRFYTTMSSARTDQYIIQYLPNANVISDLQGNFLGVSHALTNLFSFCYYQEDINKITVQSFTGGRTILSAEVLEEGKLKIISKLNFYTTNGWELLTLVATYQKR